MKLFGFTTEAHHGKHKQKNENKQKSGNSDDPQISRPDLRFASRKTAKQHKTGLGPPGPEGYGNWSKTIWQRSKEGTFGPQNARAKNEPVSTYTSWMVVTMPKTKPQSKRKSKQKTNIPNNPQNPQISHQTFTTCRSPKLVEGAQISLRSFVKAWREF